MSTRIPLALVSQSITEWPLSDTAAYLELITGSVFMINIISFIVIIIFISYFYQSVTPGVPAGELQVTS